MSLEKIESAKRDKGFKKPDLIIYCILALIIAAIFLALFLTRNGGELKGVRVDVRYEKVFEYDFESGEYSLYGDFVEIDGECDETLTVKITSGGGYNIIEIDRLQRRVKVIESDCRGKDCVHTSAITDNNGIIFCSPHALRITPYDYETRDDEYILF